MATPRRQRTWRFMDSMLVFDRTAVRRHRDRAARTLDPVADVLRDAAERLVDRLDDTNRQFTDALDVGGRGIVAPLLRQRGLRVVSSDLSPAMAALNGGTMRGGGRGIPALRPRQLRPDRRQPVAALGQRPARRPAAASPGPAPRGPAARQPSRTGHIGRTAHRPDRSRSPTSPAAPPPGSRRSPNCATAPICCSAPASSCRSPISRRSACSTPTPFTLLTDLRAAGETNAIRQRARNNPPRALFPAALARMPVVDGRMAATLRMAVMTGWAPA